MTTPKVFISYSWSTPSHERWVLDLAEELMASGINVILDKWDLKPGQDSITFMEQMVTDTTIDKVIIISDKVYSEKADGRSGGVGTESQIISKKIYEQVNQERFIAVIAEKDPDRYAEGFESLIRCIHGQPQFKKPELGSKPEYLNIENNLNLGTAPLFKRAISAMRDQKPFAAAALEEYLSAFSKNLEKIRIEISQDELFDESVVKNIENFIPSRNDLLQIISTSCRYLPQEIFAEFAHKFLESLLIYFNPTQGQSSYRSTDFDNFKFIISEIFLYTITILIKNDKLQAVATLLNQSYYIQNSNRGIPYLATFEYFCQHAESLEYRNNRLNLGRTSLSADIIKNNNNGSGVEFNQLMQTEFILFVRANLDNSGHWWPQTLVYLGHFPGAFEIFIRATSKQYFEKIKPLLNIKTKSDLDDLIAQVKANGSRYYGLGSYGFNFQQLLNYDNLCTTS